MFLIPEYFLGDPVGSETKATDFLNDAENPVSLASLMFSILGLIFLSFASMHLPPDNSIFFRLITCSRKV